MIYDFHFQRLAYILYDAAKEGGFVDPHTIEEILKVPNPKNSERSSVLITEETVTGMCFTTIQTIIYRERENPYYFLSANQRKDYIRIYSSTECDLTMNRCGWHIWARNGERNDVN